MTHAARPRYCIGKAFPRYAYLPGHGLPHPVRDPGGHSFGVGDDPVASDDWWETPHYLWGVDLFNHGYYWEAHEAWEALWQQAPYDSEDWSVLKALILLAAAGVKIREGKAVPARRHADRAGALLDRIGKDRFQSVLGMPAATLAERARAATRPPVPRPDTAEPASVFAFFLAPRRT